MSLPREQPTVDKKVADPTSHRSGQTTPQTNDADGASSPRLPNEHDESADSQSDGARHVMRRAADDVAAGQVDTDRGPLVDQLYEQKVRPPGEETRNRSKPKRTDK